MYTVTEVSYINGYKVVVIPDYGKPPTVSGRWYYEHVVIMECEIGRFLSSDDHVHHLDGNRGNNTIKNLVVLSAAHHARVHKWMQTNGIESAEYMMYPSCGVCGKTLQHKQKLSCSVACELKTRPSRKPSKEELAALLETSSMEAIGRLYGVSGKAVRKWKDSFNL